MNDLQFIHDENTIQSNDINSFPEVNSGFIEFKTCLRRIRFFSSQKPPVFLNQETDQQSLRIYRQDEALQFLIELLCGLKSRIIGETEIFGQFKVFCDTLTEHQKKIYLPEAIIQFVLTTVKNLRDQHIKNWGVQSYGALIRKSIKNFHSVDLIGYGQLAKEIQPWLENKNLKIIVRDLLKVHSQNESLSNKDSEIFFNLSDLKSMISSEVVIIAAPLDNKILLQHFKAGLKHNTLSLIIDCRAFENSKMSSLKSEELFLQNTNIQIIELNDLFLKIEIDKIDIQNKLKLVQTEISHFINIYKNKLTHRPLGWEDLCH